MAKRKTVKRTKRSTPNTSWFAVVIGWVSAMNHRIQDSFFLVEAVSQGEARDKATKTVKDQYVVDAIKLVKCDPVSATGSLSESIIDVSSIGRASWLGMDEKKSRKGLKATGRRVWWAVAQNWVEAKNMKNKTCYYLVYAVNEVQATNKCEQHLKDTFMLASIGNAKVTRQTGLTGQLNTDTVCVSLAKRSTRLFQQKEYGNGQNIETTR